MIEEGELVAMKSTDGKFFSFFIILKDGERLIFSFGASIKKEELEKIILR